MIPILIQLGQLDVFIQICMCFSDWAQATFEVKAGTKTQTETNIIMESDTVIKV